MKTKYLAAAGALVAAGLVIGVVVLAVGLRRGLDGTWEAFEGVKDGVGQGAPGLRLTFDGNKMTAVSESPWRDERPEVFMVAVDTKAKTIDILQDGKRALGIYKIEDEVLTLCIPKDEYMPRPTRFESARGSKIDLLRLRKK